MKRIFLIAIAVSSLYTVALAQKVYDARIGEKEILTPTSKASPTLNGPTIYGARPGSAFVYRIPCQGTRPIKFTASNLPTG